MNRRQRVYDQGAVVSVPFLFTDHQATKNRPAVVVSSRRYNQSRQELILAGLTSNVAAMRFFGSSQIIDWQSCGLRAPSVVSGILQTVRRQNVRRQVGLLSGRDIAAMTDSFREALGL